MDFKSFIIYLMFLTYFVETKPHLIGGTTFHFGIPIYSTGAATGNTGASTASNINSRSSVNTEPCTNGCQVNEGGYIAVHTSSVQPASHVSNGNKQSSYGETHFVSSSSSSQSEYHQGSNNGNQGTVTYGLAYPSVTIQSDHKAYIPPKETSDTVYISSSNTGQTENAASVNNRGSIGFGVTSDSQGSTDTSSGSQFSVASSSGGKAYEDSSSSNGYVGGTYDEQSDASFDISSNHARSIDSQSSINSANEQSVGIGAYPSYSSSSDSTSQFDSSVAGDSSGYIGYSSDCGGMASSQSTDTQSSNAGSSFVLGTDSQTSGDQAGSVYTSFGASSSNDGSTSSKNHVRSIEGQSSFNAADGSTMSSSNSNGYSEGSYNGNFGFYPLMPSIVYQSHGNHDVKVRKNNEGANTESQFSFSAAGNQAAQNTETRSSVSNQGYDQSNGGFYIGGRTETTGEPNVATDTKTGTVNNEKINFQTNQATNHGVFPLSITIHTHVPQGSTGTQFSESSGRTDTNQGSTKVTNNSGFGVSVSGTESKPKHHHVATTNDAAIQGNFLFPGLTVETHKRHIPSGSSTINGDVGTGKSGVVITTNHHHKVPTASTGVVFSVNPGTNVESTGKTNVDTVVHHHHRTKSTPALVIPLPILTPFIGTETSVSGNTGTSTKHEVSGDSGLGLFAKALTHGFSFGIN